MKIIENLIRALAPHRCLTCGAEGSLLCDPCLSSVKAPSRRCFKCHTSASHNLCAACRTMVHLTNLYITSEYAGVAKELIHSLKFERAHAAAFPLAKRMSSDIPLKYTAISPIPTASSRIRQRGYDQAAVIAKHLARILDVPYVPLLRRHGQQRQLGQSRVQRHLQMSETFEALPRKNKPEDSILLIDDVITTGSTVEAACTVLYCAGYRSIDVAIFAAA